VPVTPESRQIERFLGWNFLGGVVGAASVFAIWLIYPWWMALVLACVVAVSSAVVKCAQRRAGRGDGAGALRWFAASCWGVASIVGIAAPIVFPAVVLVAFLPLALVIPYGTPRFQAVSFTVGGAIAALLAAATLLDPLVPLEFIPDSVLHAVYVVYIPVVAGLFCLSMWYAYVRTQAANAELRRANAALQESEASLERKVAERTAELESSRQQLAQARDLAVDANLAKSRFLATASHDLRQPIHALRLFAEALGDGDDPARMRGLAARIRDSADSLTGMFDELLDLSRLEAGAIEARPIDFPLGPLLEQLAAELGPEAGARGLELRSVPTSALVRSDPILLRRILQNLLTNALRYTERGKVLAGCRRRGRELRIEVWDTGPGIPESKRAEIFREFTQLDQARRSEGLGLGLAIVDRLARLLDARVALDSVVGRGTVFRVSVPLSSRAPGTRPAVLRPAAASGLAGRLVVVVDDDLNILDAMRELLGSWGCELLLARSADEAIEGLKLRARDPDAILADYSLEAGATGVEAIEAIRAASGVRAPAAIITGETDPELLARLRGADIPHLTKPIPPARLRAALGHLLRTR
jgi:signal transduction histidine kinase/CheY-like chemotaxis protein